MKVNRDVLILEFEGVMSQIGALNYPLSAQILVSLGFWGPSGDYELEFLLDINGTIKTIYKKIVHRAG
jgi:hypothetical protein